MMSMQEISSTIIVWQWMDKVSRAISLLQFYIYKQDHVYALFIQISVVGGGV